MEKAVFWASTKVNTSKQRQAEPFFSPFPLQPCLLCTLGSLRNLMFLQTLLRNLTATLSAAALLVSPVVKNSMWGNAGLLCISHMKARTATNKQASNKSEQQSQAWDRPFPGYYSSFVSGLSCLSWCNVTPAGSRSPTSLYLCCPLARIRGTVSEVVLFFNFKKSFSLKTGQKAFANWKLWNLQH